MRKAYKVTVPATSRDHANSVCDDMISDADDLGVRVEASGIRSRIGAWEAYIRFRADDDQGARWTAWNILGPQSTFSLVTGYGVHERDV